MRYHRVASCPKCGGTGKVIDSEYAGRILRAKRIRKGISLRGLAHLIGVSPTYICDLEKGRREWHEDMIDRYEKVLRDQG